MEEDISDKRLLELTAVWAVKIADDIAFLAAWEEGCVPWPSAFLRVRQIHRANPYLSRHRP
jgi:hypothetical protein